MSNLFLDFQKTKNMKLLKLDNKEKYYADLLNIEHSWSDRIDSNISNVFIMEAEQQLINSIELFELGYFDCAYYSLRSSIELSTVMVFLADMPDCERNKFFDSWRSTKEFPTQGQIIKQLSLRGNIFLDMKEKMPTFFSDTKKLNAKINKYVHKQGFQHFYVVRNISMNVGKLQTELIEKFEYYLKKCIGVVAVMRLAIDPFPFLLMDNDILYRSFPLLTLPYSKEFVNEYIGYFVLEQYKQTEIFQGTYEWLKGCKKKNEATFNVTNYEYIDSTKIEFIIEQFELLSINAQYSVLLVASNEKVVKIYCLDGMLMYFTDRKTNRKETHWSSLDFSNFSKSDKLYNQAYGEAYISVFKFKDGSYFIEHNDFLVNEEIKQIDEYVKKNFKRLSSNFDNSFKFVR